MKTPLKSTGCRIFFILAFAKASLLLTSCKSEPLDITKVTATLEKIDAQREEKESINEFIAPYKQSLDEQMNEVLCYNPTRMHKNDSPLNTPIGNMMTQVVYEQANPIFNQRTGEDIHIVLLNHGGIRAPLEAGTVTTRNVYEIMPFENELVVARLTGDQVNQLINYLVSRERAHPIWGLELTIKKGGTLVRATIQNEEIKSDRIYNVATNDYLYNGGDRMSFFKDTPMSMINYKLRNAMIDYFSRIDTLNFTTDSRFTYEK
jgi:5'-nucleotidase